MPQFLLAAREPGAGWELVAEVQGPLPPDQWAILRQDFEGDGFPLVCLAQATQMTEYIREIYAPTNDGSDARGADLRTVARHWRTRAKATLATLYRSMEAGNARLVFPTKEG